MFEEKLPSHSILLTIHQLFTQQPSCHILQYGTHDVIKTTCSVPTYDIVTVSEVRSQEAGHGWGHRILHDFIFRSIGRGSYLPLGRR